MKKFMFTLLWSATLLLMFFGNCIAETQTADSSLMQVIESQDQKIERLLKRVEELEQRQELDAAKAATQAIKNQQQEAKIESLTSGIDKIQNLDLKPVQWAKNLAFSGDLRYRYEFINEEDKENRNRNRIRARFGLKTKLADDWEVGIQLATGSSAEAVSTNQTLDDGFGKKSVWLDLAYLNWTPKQMEGLSLTAGKMKNPFLSPGRSDLIWDGDVNPEGVAAGYVYACEPLEFFTNAGGFYLDERSSDTDAALWAVQGGVKYRFSSDVYLMAGMSLYDFTHLKDQPVLGVDNKPLGNSAYKIGNTYYYREDYRLWEGFTELGLKLGTLPTTLFADFVRNTTFTEEKQAFLVGFGLGKCKDPRSWEIRYNYRKLERDSVLAAMTDSDFIGGGTDGKGHKVSVDYQVTKPMKLGLTFFYNDKGLDEEKKYHRVQADVNYKF